MACAGRAEPAATEPPSTTAAPTTTTTGIRFDRPGGWARAADPALRADGYQWISAVVVVPDGVVAAGLDSSTTDADAAVWVSADGNSWTQVEDAALEGFGAQGIHEMARGGPGIVAVGFDGSNGPFDGAVWHSVDGRDWTRVAQESFRADGDQEITTIINTGHGFIAAGSDSVGRSVDAAVWVSADAHDWRRVFDPALGGFGSQRIHAIAAGPGGFVAVGSHYQLNHFGLYDLDGRVWFSEDGESWTVIDDEVFGGPGWQFVTAITAGPDGFVAAGTHILGHPGEANDITIWLSPDGLTWTRIDEAVFDLPRVQRVSAMISGPDGIVAVGYDTHESGNRMPAVWTSPNGIGWVRVVDPRLGEPGNRWMNTVAHGGPGLIAAGGDGDRPVGDPAVWLFVKAVSGET